MERRGTVVWKGTPHQGEGLLSTESGVLQNVPYSFRKRFENEKGTNPEELIAAAHASCFSMMLTALLMKARFEPEALTVDAFIMLEKENNEWSIEGSHLMLHAVVPGIENKQFQELAEEAKNTCPVSRMMSVPITLEAELHEESGT